MSRFSSLPGLRPAARLRRGSLALGAAQWQTLVRVVLLTASPGIFSAIMIGMGRAVGETMIVLMATGNTPLMDFNIVLMTISQNCADDNIKRVLQHKAFQYSDD